MIIDYEVNIIEIESSAGNISSDKNSNLSFFKSFECLDSISLVHISVDIGSLKSISIQVSLELFCFRFPSRKNHHFVVWIFCKNFLEHRVSIMIRYLHKWVIDRIYSWCFWENKWYIFAIEIWFKKPYNLVGVGCRKCHYLLEIWEWLPDFFDWWGKSHIHHLIDFINNKKRNIRKVDKFSLHHIHKSSWSSNNNLWSWFEKFDLSSHWWSTKNSHRSHSHIFWNWVYFFPSLHDKFSCGSEDENLWFSHSSIDAIERRDNKGSSFSWSCEGLDS